MSFLTLLALLSRLVAIPLLIALPLCLQPLSKKEAGELACELQPVSDCHPEMMRGSGRLSLGNPSDKGMRITFVPCVTFPATPGVDYLL